MTKRLNLLNLVDETIDLLELNYSSYLYVEGLLKKIFAEILDTQNSYIELNSRIKSEKSLKEKIIRNKYYLEYTDGNEILNHLPDLIGITVKCRFISDEETIFKYIASFFNITETSFSQSKINPNLYLNILDEQPKLEVNGYKTYRLDGYFVYNQKQVNFELQIKSLTHSFWSDIEHEIIYKNNQFLISDGFMKRIMNSIRENLNVVDSQIKYVSEEALSQNSLQKNIGLSEGNFKVFLAKAINDLYCKQMQALTAIDTNFKKSSEIISQYIYIQGFLRSKFPQQQMISYYEQLNYLHQSEIGLIQVIEIEENVLTNDDFIDNLGNFCLSKMNIDFDFHAFFAILFSVQNDFSIEQLTQFLRVIRELYFPPAFYQILKEIKSSSHQEKIYASFMNAVSDALISVGDISIFYEEKITEISKLLIDYITELVTLSAKKVEVEFFCELRLQIKKIF